MKVAPSRPGLAKAARDSAAGRVHAPPPGAGILHGYFTRAVGQGRGNTCRTGVGTCGLRRDRLTFELFQASSSSILLPRRNKEFSYTRCFESSKF